MLKGSPFAGTDFTGGGMPEGGGPGDPAVWAGGNNPNGPAPTTPTGGTPDRYAPDISLGMDPTEGFNRAYSYLSSLISNPRTSTDPITKEVKEDPTWANQVAMAQKQVDTFVSEFQKTGATAAAKEAQQLADAAALERTRISSGASVQSASISAGASAFSAQEATRRQAEADQRAAEEAARGREFTGGENALNRQATSQNIDVQQKFEAEQNALNREIQRIQAEIAAGNLNLNTASTVLQKWLDAQQYSLPKGAEYVPGFQPGGGVQEAARLAGVSYNPANYKANTVPFNPADVVRQTMGR